MHTFVVVCGSVWLWCYVVVRVLLLCGSRSVLAYGCEYVRVNVWLCDCERALCGSRRVLAYGCEYVRENVWLC